MILEFSISNYRSFKEKQTFSMVAGTNSKNAFPTKFKAAPNLLHTAALFGANASGKSNLVKAMAFFQSFVQESAKDRNSGEEIDGATPFAFSEKSSIKPCEFEIVFICVDNVYQYGFLVDKVRVYKEWLYATSIGGSRDRQRTIFERNWDAKSSKYIWKTSGLKEDSALIVKSTRDNALFLSTADMLNNLELKDPFNWIRMSFTPVPALNRFSHEFTASLLKKKAERNKIISMLKNADTRILDLAVKESVISENDLPKDMPDVIKKEILKEMSGKKIQEVYSLHRSEEGSLVPLALEEESTGTQILFGLIGPLLDILKNGYILIIDELDNSLHPLLLKEIIRLFSDKKINKKNAQLIFTCHDTTVLDEIERDQVWLLEKGKLDETRISSILEYKPREGENIRRNYLSGRYGGLPAIERLINGQN